MSGLPDAWGSVRGGDRLIPGAHHPLALQTWDSTLLSLNVKADVAQGTLCYH